MPQRLTTSFINTAIPGAYFEQNVKSIPVGVAVSGNIVIIGEAEEGRSISQIDPSNGVLLKNNIFAPSQADLVAKEYGKGPIVDAFNALVNASADPDITGAPTSIAIVKTNVGTKASLAASTYGTFESKNVGVSQNKISAEILQAVAEVKPSITSGNIPSFGAALDGLSFTVRVNGGTETVITLGVGGHTNNTTLASEINGLLPTGLECVVGPTASTIIIRSNDATDGNVRQGSLSFELIDSTLGDLASLGLSAQLVQSSQEPKVQVDIKRSDISLNESFTVGSDVVLWAGYQGTTASASISNGTLSFTVAGGSGSNLSINLSEHATLSDLADFINSQVGYVAKVNPSFGQISPLNLDEATFDCAVTGNFAPGGFKIAAYSFKSEIDKSKAVSFSLSTKYGLPAIQAKAFLSGGSKGGTSAADIVKAFDALKTIDVNFVVPLFSRDASLDIADGLTDSSSTYTIDAINSLAKTHVLSVSTPAIQKHRMAFVSYDGKYVDAKNKAGDMGHYRVAFCIQRPTITDSEGKVVEKQPWLMSCIAAGMQAAAFYKPIFNKLLNVISVKDPEGFDSGDAGSLEDALSAGLLVSEKAVDGDSWVSDQTTYTKDTNFVYNSIQAVYNSDLLSLDLSKSIKKAYVGKSLADIDAGLVSSFLSTKAESYRQQKLITSSKDAPLGYKNDKVTIVAPNLEISIEFKLSTGVYFAPISLFFSQVSK